MKKIFILLLMFVFAANVYAVDVAKINDTYYASVSEAINAANEGDEIKILVDIDDTSKLEINEQKDIIIDLGGYLLKHAISNYGKLTIKNGSMNNEGTNFFFNGIKNQKNAELVLDQISIEALDNSTWCIVNEGKITMKNSDFFSQKEFPKYISNEADGTIEMELINLDGYTLFENKGKMTISGGIFRTHNDPLNFNYGELIINGGYFESKKDFIKNTRGTLTINDGEFNVATVAENYDPNYSKNTEKIKSTIIVNGGVFNVSATAFNNSSIGRYSVLQFNGGKITSDTTESIIGEYGDETNSIIINGGEIDAKKSKGFLLSGGDFIIGKKDETVSKDSPLIDIRSGRISGIIKEPFQFYDGTIIVNNKLDEKATLLIPEGYYVKYDENEDKSLTAYLVENETNTANAEQANNETNEEVYENTPTNEEATQKNNYVDKTVENPKTGIIIPIVAIIGMLIIGICSYLIIKNKNYFIKI